MYVRALAPDNEVTTAVLPETKRSKLQPAHTGSAALSTDKPDNKDKADIHDTVGSIAWTPRGIASGLPSKHGFEDVI